MSKEFFNSKAEEWDQMVNHDPVKIQHVLRGLPDQTEPVILDVGSGTGVMIPFLKERFGKDTAITAVDFAEKMIEVSQRKHQHEPNLQFVVADILTDPLPVQRYDLILCYSCFPHFQDKAQILQRFLQLLKPAGRVLIFHSQSRQAINNLHRHAGEEVREDRLPAASKVAELAKSLGYMVERLVDNDEMYVVEIRI